MILDIDIKNMKKTFSYDFELESLLRKHINNDSKFDIVREHSADVLNTAVDINNRLNLKIERHLLAYSAYLHDMFVFEDKVNHHQKAYNYVKLTKDDIITRLSSSDRILISNAVHEHRSCFKKMEYYSDLSAVIAAADLGKPILKNIVGKAFVYDLYVNKKLPLKEVLLKTFTYVKTKYGDDGYFEYNFVYNKAYKYELIIMKKQVNELTLDDLHRYVTEYCNKSKHYNIEVRKPKLDLSKLSYNR